ncbi:MAG: cobalamin biosynthesis protein CbiD [Eubacterium sp.]|nr:cobalamin biosynthesis protein CbiD [Eubacterium sp.]
MKNVSQNSPQYTLVNHKLLRSGYTTGSCAAAAAKAAVFMLLTGKQVEEMPLQTPAGILLHLVIEEIRIRRDASGRLPSSVRCAVRKDGGDDIDATDGMLIFADVRRTEGDSIIITGGEGIGIVTRPGLDQPVGNPAINSGPRGMILKEAEAICGEHGYHGGLEIVISAPEGKKIAEKTFNSHMGIEGGISILGTTGIVMPMSQKALLDSIALEIRMLRAAGFSYLIMSPGNYGARFLKEQTGLDPSCSMKCSNFVGETLDLAESNGVKGILFVAHIGKFIKLSGGIMNTHSRESDARMELLAGAALRAGADADVCRRILDALTTDEALLTLEKLAPERYADTIRIVSERIQYHLDRRTAGHMKTGVILFAGKDTFLADTGTVAELRALLAAQAEEAKNETAGKAEEMYRTDENE